MKKKTSPKKEKLKRHVFVQPPVKVHSPSFAARVKRWFMGVE